jgi:ribonuclease E
MKRMLINATQAEERRLAIVDGQKLLDYEIEIEGREQRKGNIYKAVVTRVEPSLEACFVDYGEDRHGFLPFKEISRQYFAEGVAPSQARINDVIREGQELLVQVEKEERGNKGAALTTFVSLAGRYVVLMPNNPRGGGVSRRIEGDDRAELKEAMDQLEYPKGMSIIARTAGIGRSAPELQWDLNYLLKLWSAIDGAAKSAKGAFLIYQESSLVIRAIRDYFNSDIGDILIDTDDIYEQAQQFMSHVMPEHAARVKRYRDDAALFSRFQIEHQIESAYARTVSLPSGGAIVIDHTEALVSVDVNSARAIKGGDIEETALRTNLEAADEVARQMRLRDLGGLIVIDFIDMEESKNRREVENRLRDALRQDRARVQFGTISKFGLMEMSRQRLKPALSEGASIPCPRCGGSGHVRDTESSALQILRIIQEESMKDNTAAVHLQVPVEVASFLLNEKRPEIAKIELKQRVRVTLIPNKQLETPNYKLERIKHDDNRLDSFPASYKLAETIEDATTVTRRSQEPTNKQVPVIKGVLRDAPAPAVPAKPSPVAASPAAAPAEQSAGIWGWFKQLIGLAPAPAPAAEPVKPNPASKNPRAARDGQRRNDGRGRTAAERSERSERTDRTERGERSTEARRSPARTERNPNPEAVERQERAASAERGEARRRPANERNERTERGERGERTERAERGERSNERTERRNGRRETSAETAALEPSELNNPAEQTEQRLEGEAGELRQPRGERGNRRERAPRAERGASERRERSPRGSEEALNDASTETLRSMVEQPAAAATAPAFDAPSTAETVSPTATEQMPVERSDNGAPRERRSRDRYGRDRRNRREQQVDSSAQPADSGEPSSLERVATDAAASAEPDYAAPAVASPVSAPVAPVVASAAAAPSTLESGAVAAAEPQQPSSAATTLAPATPAAAPRYLLPTQELATLAASAGLQWINSDLDKVAAAQAAIAAEPKTIHVPRERQPLIPLDQGPLVLVETRRDLRDIQLPFERSQG